VFRISHWGLFVTNRSEIRNYNRLI
jgi:hypothetical protein